MSAAQRDKGARAEREVAAIFQAAGFDCNRVPNSGGLRIKGDLYGDVPAHVEVKRQETARPWLWFEQARSEAPEGALPLVAFRRTRSPWLAIVPLEALVALLALTSVNGADETQRTRVGGAATARPRTDDGAGGTGDGD